MGAPQRAKAGQGTHPRWERRRTCLHAPHGTRPGSQPQQGGQGRGRNAANAPPAALWFPGPPGQWKPRPGGPGFLKVCEGCWGWAVIGLERPVSQKHEDPGMGGGGQVPQALSRWVSQRWTSLVWDVPHPQSGAGVYYHDDTRPRPIGNGGWTLPWPRRPACSVWGSAMPCEVEALPRRPCLSACEQPPCRQARTPCAQPWCGPPAGLGFQARRCDGTMCFAERGWTSVAKPDAKLLPRTNLVEVLDTHGHTKTVNTQPQRRGPGLGQPWSQQTE